MNAKEAFAALLRISMLSDFDRELLTERHDIRWRNTAMWVRLEMVKAGYLSNQSPRGVWEITDEGKKYLANMANHQAPEKKIPQRG